MTRSASIDAREALSELLWPTRCVGCNLPGELLCEQCRADLPWIDQRWACPVCGAPGGWLTCTECDRSRDHVDQAIPSDATTSVTAWDVRATICSLPFDGVGAALVTCLKDGHELRLAPIMAAAMACSLDEARAWDALDGRPRFDALHTDVLCFVPATPAAYARRGFDHMELVARALSPFIDVPVLDALARRDASDQRALGKESRAQNLAGTIEVVADVHGLNVLLADDVITTGSSMNEAARVLLAHGAKSVTACALARVC
ncbi:MAG: phosphoribosyltransferase family protein [Coriobacteriales bacterium]|nr:phosphoribosyltransferase family protein [Coriobacteriales bacterium]